MGFEKNYLSILKNPEALSQFIFNQSIKSVSLNKVDEKISYDKYLDDLVDTIKDKKSQYFYKNEFKSLFFNNIRTKGKKENQYNITPEKFKVLLNTISYKWNGTTKVLQPMSYRWLVQTLKKNPEATLEDIEKLIEPSERALRRERMAREGPIAF